MCSAGPAVIGNYLCPKLLYLTQKFTQCQGGKRVTVSDCLIGVWLHAPSANDLWRWSKLHLMSSCYLDFTLSTFTSLSMKTITETKA